MHIAVKGFIHGNKRFSNKNNVIFCGKCYFMLTTKNRPADCGIIMQKKQVYFKNITPEHNCALFEGIIEVTRPDTRPIPVADRWAGAEMRVFTLSNSITMTDRETNGRTDKTSYRVACPQLKT